MERKAGNEILTSIKGRNKGADQLSTIQVDQYIAESLVPISS